MPAPSNWAMIPAPSWYPGTLPKFYRPPDNSIRVWPLGSVKGYTDDSVLDMLLYYQTVIGYNRIDFSNARNVAATQNGKSAANWVRAAFMPNQDGDGSGDWSAFPFGFNVDGALYSKLQSRYVAVSAATMPWLAAMQGKGGGIDLMTMPMGTDIEQPRPSWYPTHLPSLFKSTGLPYQQPAGTMNTKPKIQNWKSSGSTQYAITADDVANLMVYAQPIVYDGPTPYPLNWYINDVVNGAIAMRFKVSLNVDSGFSNAQAQTWGIVGDIMKAPVLDANPYASGFTQALEKIVSFAISYFAGKIPGGTKAITAAYTAGKISGGEYVTGDAVPPAGTFTLAVFNAAHQMEQQLQQQAEASKQNSTMILIAAAAIIAGLWAHDEGYI